MAATSIEWTDATWNPTTGCTRASEGCDHCYAFTMTKRLAAMGQKKYQGLVGNGHFNGVLKTHEDELAKPLRWRKPRRVFVNSMSDLFHKDVPFEFVAAVFGVAAGCPQHTFQILTKRPERAAWFLEWIVTQATPHTTEVAVCQHFAQRKSGAKELRDGSRFEYWTWPLGNVWLGTSVENQATADERIPHLLRCPAAVRFLSCEPLLGEIELCVCHWREASDERCMHDIRCPLREEIHWVIVGSESGPKRRPMQQAWAESIAEQCESAGVAFFMKQMEVDGKVTGDVERFPARLRIREFPGAPQ